MADYMLLWRNVGTPTATLPEEEKAAAIAAWGAWMVDLEKQGILKGGGPFNPAAAAVISANGDITEGYYAENDDINVGGFIQFSAADLTEAIAVAKGGPALHGPASTVEVKEFLGERPDTYHNIVDE